jgi:hypothetical protein
MPSTQEEPAVNRSISTILITVLASATGALHATQLAPLRDSCRIGLSEETGKLSLHIDHGECQGDRQCGSSFSNESMSRFTGISQADLAREGARLTATLAAEAGTFTCTGTVHNQELSGEAVFTPDPAFIDRMAQMGFTGFSSEKLRAYALINVESAFARSLQETGVRGITIDNLIALRIFNVDPAYIKSITALGYDLPDAQKLIALKVQKVDAEEVRELRALGYQPTLDELIQVRIFHITPEFIHHMQDRGFKDLTIAKLVQIRIFKLAE